MAHLPHVSEYVEELENKELLMSRDLQLMTSNCTIKNLRIDVLVADNLVEFVYNDVGAYV